MTSALSPCPRCGQPLDPSRATYDKNGVMLCAACSAKSQIVEGDARATNSLVSTAVGVFVGGFLSWTCLGMYGVLPFVCVAAGIGWLVNIGRNKPLRDRLGGKLVWCVVAVVLGLGAGGFALLVNLLALFGILGTRR